MNLSDFIPHLGAPSDDPALVSMIQGLGYDQPLLPAGRADEKYIEDHARGFHMMFRDEAQARQPIPRDVLEGSYILVSVTATTANKRGYKTFSGALPHGIRFEMSRVEVRERLGLPAFTSDFAPVDRWHFPDHRLFVEFVREETSIRIAGVEYP